MPKIDTPQLDEVRHEYFCQPTEGRNQIRLEGFPSYIDDPNTGRSRPTQWVTRCVECGASTYRPI